MRKTFFISSFLSLVLLAVFQTGCSSKAQRAAKHMQKADGFFTAGKYDDAELEYIAALKMNPYLGHAFGRLGAIYFDDGRLSQAFAYLKRGVQLDTNDLDVHLKLAQFCLVAGRAKEAREEASLVLMRRPDDEEAPQVLADASISPKDYEATVARLEHASLAPDKMAPTYSALASLYYRQHNIKATQDAFLKARASNPNCVLFYANLGGFYWNQNQLKMADDAFKRAAELSPIRSPRRLRYAQFKVQNADVEAAKKMLSEIEKQAPDFLPAELALAEISAGEKKYPLAQSTLEKVLARDPENYDGLLLNARLAELQNDQTRAVSAYEKAASVYSHSPQIIYQLATAYVAANDTQKAIEKLNQCLVMNSNYVDASLALAQLKYQKGDAGSAIVALRQLVQQHPQYIPAYLLLADVYRHQENYEDAIGTYQRAETLAPQNVQAPLMLGMMLSQLSRNGEARKEFNKALQIAPSSLNVVEQLVALDVAEKNFDAAIQQVKLLQEKFPDILEANLLLAKIYLAMKQPQMAEEVLSNTIKTHPDFQTAYITLAHVYEQIDQNLKSLQVLEQMTAKFPENLPALMEVGIVQERLKDTKAARQTYEKLLAKNPSFSAALNNVAGLYLEAGDVTRAYDCATRAHELMPYDPSTDDTLGWVLYQRGQYAQAEPLLQESASKLVGAPDVQLHLGLTRYMLGDEEAARAPLQFALQSQTEFNGKEEGARCLAIMAINPNTAQAGDKAILEKAVKTRPTDAIALEKLATVYLRTGSPDKAQASYEALLKLNPKNVPALIALAGIYAAQPQQSQKAFEIARSAYKLAPGNPQLDCILGPMAYQSGDYKWSLILLSEATRKLPPTPELMYDLAKAQYAAGMISEAVNNTKTALASGTTFTRSNEANNFLQLVQLEDDAPQALANRPLIEQTLKADPGNVPALMVSGLLAEQKSDLAAARKAFEKVLAKFPDFSPAKRQLALIYAQDGSDDKKALSYASPAHQAYPADLKVTRALGIISYRLGDYTRSVKFLKDVSASTSEDGQLLFYLGMGQYQLKQKAESKKNLQLAMNLDLPDSLAADAKKTLNELNNAKK